MAYVVDTSIDNDRSGEGVSEARRRFAQYLPPDNPDGSPTSRAQVQALIVPGGSASYGDLTLSVTAGSASGDTVRLSRIP